MFNIEEEKKSFFNRVEFYNYEGPIPSYKWYNPNPDKRAEFFQLYDEQVNNDFFLNFQKEMVTYCHSDAELLRLGTEKFRQLFLTRTKEDGAYIGVDSYNHLTIPSVAFEGV